MRKREREWKGNCKVELEVLAAGPYRVMVDDGPERRLGRSKSGEQGKNGGRAQALNNESRR